MRCWYGARILGGTVLLPCVLPSFGGGIAAAGPVWQSELGSLFVPDGKTGGMSSRNISLVMVSNNNRGSRRERLRGFPATKDAWLWIAV